MATPGAFGGQIGWKSESTWGTAVTVDQFHPGFRTESITQTIERLESNGKRAGRYVNHNWQPGRITVGGQVDLELWDEPMATLLRHMFGTISTSGAGPYTHTASPGDLTSQSLTIEVGRSPNTGTVESFVYAGCKIPSWTLNCSAGEIPRLNLTVSGKSEARSGSTPASASYTTANPFTFVEGSLTIAGAEVVTVTSATLQASNALVTDRHFLNSANIREQLDGAGSRTFTGSVQAEFESLTAYERFVNGTEAAMVYKFDNSTDSLTITMNVRFDGTTPTTPDDGLLAQPLPFKCTSGTSDSAAIQAVLVNAESSNA